jgi:hypothetical protein
LRAALALGYTRSSWNNGLSIPTESKDWNELNADEKEAANVLGYDQQKWDGNSISSSSSSSNSLSPQDDRPEVDNYYDDYDFEELPSAVKLAALDLGYTQSVWDGGGRIPADEKDWDELSSMERAAATVLGYTKEKWDIATDDSRSCPARDEVNLIQAVSVNYDDFEFDELPPLVKQAAIDLGFTKVIWDTDGDIPAYDKDWDELNPQEKEAAQKLGYTRETWDDSTSESAASQAHPPVQESRHNETGNYDNCDFMELPPLLRQAAIDLGYTRYLWDNDLPVESDSKRWDELRLEEQEAAMVFGYNRYKWDQEMDGPNEYSPSSPSDQTDSVSQKYYDYYFHRLPPSAVEAAVYLGYTQTAWDGDGNVAAGNKSWDELSVGEQAAARVLGYSQEEWDENSDDDSSLSSRPSLFREHLDEAGHEYIPFQISSSPSFDADPQVKYYNWNWDDLPIPILAAATVLGYTKQVS